MLLISLSNWVRVLMKNRNDDSINIHHVHITVNLAVLMNFSSYNTDENSINFWASLHAKLIICFKINFKLCKQIRHANFQ